MFHNIVQSNLHSIYNSALTVIFTPVLQNQEPKRLGAVTKMFKGREFWFQIAFFSLNPLLL